MIFIYKAWTDFCRKLSEINLHSITARDVASRIVNEKYIVLKHDVETDVQKAFIMAKIEKRYEHKGTYYVQAYLLKDERNVQMLQEMAKMGHEISYHYDVMDSCRGDLDRALEEYAKNVAEFNKNGFEIKTVCQHGNPIVDRIGYTSNRDFFRSEKVQGIYENMSDIMVNFKEKANTEFLYFSDAGRRFQQIYDPINNDIVKSDDKNIPFSNLELLFQHIKQVDCSCIISTHPHRWMKNQVAYVIKDIMFKTIRRVAKILVYIPFMKKVMSKYYYLAKKI